MQVGSTPLFWILLVVTIVIIAIELIRGISGSSNILGLPVVAGTMWLYFYGYMAARVGTTLDYMLPSWSLEAGQMLALVSYSALLAGWYYKMNRRGYRVPRRMELDLNMARRVFACGVGLLIIAIIGQYTFFGQQVIDYKNTSNYWYLMFYAGYPGGALCLLALSSCPAMRRSAKPAALGVLIVLLMWQHLLTARRGPIFPMVIVLCYVPYLVKGGRPNRGVVLGGLALAGFAMLVAVWARPYVYAPFYRQADWTLQDRLDGWRLAADTFAFQEVVDDRTTLASDNEFLYHCGALAVIWELGDYQYGTGYLTLLTHWIPRQLWPEKPVLQEGLFESHWYAEMHGRLGFGLSYGAAAGGAANAFEQLGLVVPVLWFAVGRFARFLFNGAIIERRPERIVQYTGFVCAFHWMVAQALGAMFVPACYYIVLPTMLLRIVSRGGWGSRCWEAHFWPAGTRRVDVNEAVKEPRLKQQLLESK